MKRKTIQIETAISTSPNNEYRLNIEFYVYVRDNTYVSYCPSLDLTSTGLSFNEAVSNFIECFQLHTECCLEAGTFEEDLKAHGWTLHKSQWHTPAISTILKKDVMRELLSTPVGFEKVVIPARYPVAL